MAEPTPITDALAIIDGDPVLRAVADLTACAAMNITGPVLDSAALAIVASRNPDPTTLLPRLRHLSTLLAQYDAATTALGYAVSLADIGEHTAARDAAWAEIVRVWERREWAPGDVQS